MSKVYDSSPSSRSISNASTRIPSNSMRIPSNSVKESIEDLFGFNDAMLKQLEIEEKLIQMQTAQHEHQEPFRTLLRYDLTELERMLRAKPSLVNVRDCVGANVIHIAYLVGKYSIGRRLVQLFPKEALCRYSESANNTVLLAAGQEEQELPYLGENILHITIIRRNMEETRWLLDFYRERSHSIPLGLFNLLTANARGKFFCGQFYFGGYPLQFAVCSNDTDVFDIVLTYCQGLQLDPQSQKAINESNKPGLLTIFQQDDQGNNSLHLCVLRNLQVMYKHVLQSAKGIIRHELRIAYEDKRRDIGDIEPSQETWLNITKIFNSPGKLDECCGLAPKESTVNFPSAANYISWLDIETQRKINERMLGVLNNDYHTPLTLAAASLVQMQKYAMTADEIQQRVQTLQFLIDEHKEIRWKFGPITCSLITLAGIEVPYDLRNYPEDKVDIVKWRQMRGVLEWLCIADCEQAVCLPFIKEIIETKWERVGKSVFMIKSLLHLGISILLTILSLYPYASPTAINQDYGTRVVTVTYAFTALCFMIKVGIDAVSTYLDGVNKPFRQFHYRGAALFEIQMRTIYTVAFIILLVLKVIQAFTESETNSLQATNEYISNQRIGITVCICLCVTASWLYTFYFFMGFPATAPFLITLYRIASRDIPYFLRFYVVLLISFGCPLAVLTSSGETGSSYAIVHLMYVIWQLIHETIQYQDSVYLGLDSNFVPKNVQWLYDIVHTGFYFCITITMLNLLIGMITNTYSQYANNREGLVLLERYNIMSGILKRNIHRKETIMQLQKYSINDNGTFKFQIQENNANWAADLNREGNTSTLAKKIALFILDPQNDFHDMTEISGTGTLEGRRGSLAVPGACGDSYRIADMIMESWRLIDEIVVTLDSHHPGHISNPSYWRNSQGVHPEPFTTEIQLQDVLDNIWVPVDNGNYVWAIHYLEALERSKRFTHRIWPQHCIVGSRGHAIVEPIRRALSFWEARTGRTVRYVMKGYNTKVEFYSAFQAEVTDPVDPNTNFNYELLNRLRMNDRVIVCGQAVSHTVNFTMRDLLLHWPGDKSHLILLTDGCSVVPGDVNEAAADKFLSHLVSEGVCLTKCSEVFGDIEGVQSGIYRSRLVKKKVDMSSTAHIATAAIADNDYFGHMERAVSPNMQGTWRGLSTSSEFPHQKNEIDNKTRPQQPFPRMTTADNRLYSLYNTGTMQQNSSTSSTPRLRQSASPPQATTMSMSATTGSIPTVSREDARRENNPRDLPPLSTSPVKRKLIKKAIPPPNN